MNRFWKIAIYIGLPFSTFGTISCICVLFNRPNELGFDYTGVIVGILSLLVTILLGWNIFYALEFKKDMLSKLEENECKWKKRLELHLQLNQKDFENIVATFRRSEEYCNKLDNCLLELMKMYKRNEAKNKNGTRRVKE